MIESGSINGGVASGGPPIADDRAFRLIAVSPDEPRGTSSRVERQQVSALGGSGKAELNEVSHQDHVRVADAALAGKNEHAGGGKFGEAS